MKQRLFVILTCLVFLAVAAGGRSVLFNICNNKE